MAQHPPSESPKQRTGFERILIFVVLIFLATLLLRVLGIPIVWRSESTEIIEHPHR